MSAIIPDERGGKPSASSMERLALCPGSFLAEASAPTPPASKYAERGTKIAALVQQQLTSDGDSLVPDVDSSEIEEAHRMYKETIRCYESAAAALGITVPLMDKDNLILVEQRLWSLDKTFSGKPDVVIMNGDCAIIIDHKSGWGDVTVATHNWQLRTLAVLVHQLFKKTKIAVAIVQPNNADPTIGTFDEHSLVAAEATIIHAINEAKQPNAKRIPSGKACKFCKYRPECSEARGVLVKVSTNTGIPADLSLALDMIEVADMVANDIRAQAKACLAEDPNSVPGWKLRPGSVRHSIKDTAAAYAEIKDVVSPVEFTKCCTVKFGELTKVYGKNTGLKAKEAKPALVSRLGDTIEEKVTSPVLCRANAKDGGEE